MYRRFGKRAFDLLVGGGLALVTLPLCAPLLVVLAFYWRGNPLFWQARAGLHGRVFFLLKLRSMKTGDGPDATRLTATGRLLRRTSLDELPQLWLVLTGRMSLVGPRPLSPDYLPKYSERQSKRHTVKPGITGLAQVKGRNALDWPTKLELDAQYAERLSLGLDLWIVWRTLVVVLRGTGIAAQGHASAPTFTGNE